MTFQCLKGHISLICSLLLRPSSSHDQISPFKFLCRICTCSHFTDFIGKVIYFRVCVCARACVRACTCVRACVRVCLALIFLESYPKNKMEPNEFLAVLGSHLKSELSEPSPKHAG